MFKLNNELSREENMALAEESAKQAAKLHNDILIAVEAGFKHVPSYYGTKTQQAKERTAQEVMKRLSYEIYVASRLKSLYAEQDRLDREKAAKKEAEQIKQQQISESNQLLNKAIKYLLDNGKQICVDFNVENAIKAADEIAFRLEIAKREKEEQGSPISFSGDSDCEDCAGWIPGDSRCDCGNRRVDWVEGWNHSFESPSIYAEAY